MSLGVLEGDDAGERQVQAEVQVGPGVVGPAGEAVDHPARAPAPPPRAGWPAASSWASRMWQTTGWPLAWHSCRNRRKAARCGLAGRVVVVVVEAGLADPHHPRAPGPAGPARPSRPRLMLADVVGVDAHRGEDVRLLRGQRHRRAGRGRCPAPSRCRSCVTMPARRGPAPAPAGRSVAVVLEVEVAVRVDDGAGRSAVVAILPRPGRPGRRFSCR